MDTEASRPVPLPDDLPVIERSAMRLVVLDDRGRLLLFHTRDLDHPDLGTWWELPAGVIEHGETYHDAAVRELREETGIVALPSEAGPPSWRRRASFRHRQARRVQDEVIVMVRLQGPGPPVDESRRWTMRRRTTADSAGGQCRRCSAVVGAFTTADCLNCSAPSSMAKKSMNHSSYGHDSQPIGSLRLG